MEREQLLRTYNQKYAATYDSRWIVPRPVKNQFEARLVGQELLSATSWIDVGCGTGWMLDHMSRYDVTSVGLELSPAMADRARRRCPHAQIVLGDATQRDAVSRTWGLVTCFWGAYGLQPSMSDVHQFLDNLVAWLEPGRRGLLTVIAPHLMLQRRPVGVVPANTSFTSWSYVEHDDETHSDVFAPTCAAIQDWFERAGAACEWIDYPVENEGDPPSVLRMLRYTRVSVGLASRSHG